MTYDNYLGAAMPESGTPTNTVYGVAAGGQTLTAPAGPSSVWGSGPNDTLIGSSGDNTFVVDYASDRISIPSGATGVDTAVAYTAYTLPTGVQNLTVSGDFNYAVGNSGANLIEVSGQQWVNGGGGNDVFVGGAGNATFEIAANTGSDVIYGWHVGDHIRLVNDALTSLGQIDAAMTQVGADVVLRIDPSDTLTLRNTTIAQFTANDFFLPLNTSLLGAMTFDDEFNSLSLYDPATGAGTWQTNFGGNLKDAWAYRLVSNGELQAYVTPQFQGSGDHALGYNPFSDSNGVLTITAAPMKSGDTFATYGATYSSGMIDTLGTFQQKYGYFEMRAEVPAAAGAWPAFWLDPSPYEPNQEADITEGLGLTPNVDYVRAYGGAQTQYDNTYVANPGGWHTYGLLWTAATVTFYMDGVAVLQGPTPASWTNPMAIIANLAVGGWGGNPDNASFPAQMNIDYIHAYALADGSSVVQHETPVPPAATLQVSGGPVQSTDAAAQLVSPAFVSNGASLTSGAIVFAQAAPNAASLPAGQTFFVWQNAGAVFAAVSDGTHLSTATPLMAGTVSQFTSGTWLTSGQVVVGYLETDGGVQYAWDLVFDPLTSTFVKQQLGPSTGDMHFTATAKGDFAVSWMTASGVQGRAYDAHAYDGKGWYGEVSGFSGDLLGQNGSGALVTAVSGAASERQIYNVLTPANTIPASLSISPGLLSEAAPTSGQTVFTFTVTRSFDVSGTSTVNWSVAGSGSNPAAAADFLGGVLPGGSLTFAPGQSTQTIAVDVVAPPTGGADQTFNVTINNVTGATLGAAIANGTIVEAATAAPPPSSAPVSTAAATYIVPSNVQTVFLIGAASQTVTANALGDTITSNDRASTLIGGAGADTLIAGHGADTLTGGGGADTFVFKALPWNAGHITDFAHGVDHMDISALIAASGYTGSDPIKDGYLSLRTDGSGDTQVYYDPDGPGTANPWPFLLTTLDHVLPSGVSLADFVLTATAAAPTPPTSPPPVSATVSTSAGIYVAPTGVQTVDLVGTGPQQVTANATGDVLVSNDYGSTLIGGTGADTLVAGHGADTLTGGAGVDVFTFKYLPWSAGQIADFTVGQDVIDLRPIFTAAGYTGSDPVKDGYLTLSPDGAGGTKIYVLPDGPHSAAEPWPILITDVQHVLPANLALQTDILFH